MADPSPTAWPGSEPGAFGHRLAEGAAELVGGALVRCQGSPARTTRVQIEQHEPWGKLVVSDDGRGDGGLSDADAAFRLLPTAWRGLPATLVAQDAGPDDRFISRLEVTYFGGSNAAGEACGTLALEPKPAGARDAAGTHICASFELASGGAGLDVPGLALAACVRLLRAHLRAVAALGPPAAISLQLVGEEACRRGAAAPSDTEARSIEEKLCESADPELSSGPLSFPSPFEIDALRASALRLMEGLAEAGGRDASRPGGARAAAGAAAADARAGLQRRPAGPEVIVSAAVAVASFAGSGGSGDGDGDRGGSGGEDDGNGSVGASLAAEGLGGGGTSAVATGGSAGGTPEGTATPRCPPISRSSPGRPTLGVPGPDPACPTPALLLVLRDWGPGTALDAAVVAEACRRGVPWAAAGLAQPRIDALGGGPPPGGAAWDGGVALALVHIRPQEGRTGPSAGADPDGQASPRTARGGGGRRTRAPWPAPPAPPSRAAVAAALGAAAREAKVALPSLLRSRGEAEAGWALGVVASALASLARDPSPGSAAEVLAPRSTRGRAVAAAAAIGVGLGDVPGEIRRLLGRALARRLGGKRVRDEAERQVARRAAWESEE